MAILDRKKREKKIRRQSILKAAKKIIAKSGVEDMSMNQLAEATELNKATLYLYFVNKDDLIDAIVFEGLQILDEELEECDARSSIGLERVLNQVHSIFDFYRRYPVYFHTFNHQERRPQSHRRKGPFAKEGDEVGSRVLGKMAAAIALGIEQGNIRKNVDTNVFLILMFAQIYGVMHTVHAKADVYEDLLVLDTVTIEQSTIEFLRYYLEVTK